LGGKLSTAAALIKSDTRKPCAAARASSCARSVTVKRAAMCCVRLSVSVVVGLPPAMVRLFLRVQGLPLASKVFVKQKHIWLFSNMKQSLSRMLA
jgi:hypothetical protein